VGLAVAGLWPATSRAGWDFSAAGDPTRNWSVGMLNTVGFNDNINTTRKDKESSLTLATSPTVEIRITPSEETTANLKYTYNFTHYDQKLNGGDNTEESHGVDLSLTRSINPRLRLSLADVFRMAVEPEEATGAIGGGTTPNQRRAGNYIYNTVSGSADYQLAPRWNLTVAQSWTRWQYDVAAEAERNDRDSFDTTLTASYTAGPRTFVAANYRYSTTSYLQSSTTNEVRDTDSHALYLSVTHRFQPQLVLQASAGAQMAGLGAGTSSSELVLSPYVTVYGSYNFLPESTVALGFNYFITLTEVSSYRSAETASVFLNLRHHFTRKLNAAAELSYNLSTYGNPNPNTPVFYETLNEDSYRASLSVNFDFTTWSSLYFGYVFEGISSSLTGRAYDRNRVSLGVRLTY
jgi:hypothetical protein